MDLEYGDQGVGMQVIVLGLLGVENLDGVLPALQVENRGSIEILENRSTSIVADITITCRREGQGGWRKAQASLSVSCQALKAA